MKIAILGGGFAGVATAYHLSKKHEITLFDSKGIAGGPSGIAAGLLHPYAGAHSKLNWRAREAMKSTLHLLNPSVAKQTGMLRLALSEMQLEDFGQCADKYDDVEWFSGSIPGVVSKPGIFISSAWTVDTKRYLQGLWEGCGTLEKRDIEDLAELASFDRVIITTGSSAPGVTPVKGQLLELEWPSDIPPLPFPVNSKAYILMNPDNKSCIVGATFEKNFVNAEPDLKRALEELRPKYTAIIPALENARVIECRAGVRASTPNHLPIIKQLDTRTWVYAGLGSKGLLYHSLMAEDMSLCCKVEKENDCRG